MTHDPKVPPHPATLHQLLELPVLVLRVVIRMQTAAGLPPFKSSTFRGVLGVALKREVCQHSRRESCEGCPLLVSCTYPWLFEGRSTRANPWYQQSAASPPMRVLVEDESSELLAPGSELTLRVVLYGRACEMTGLLLRCLDMAGSSLGVGKGQLHGGGRFQRVSVFDGESGALLCTGSAVPPAVAPQGISCLAHPLPPTGQRRVVLRTPLQYKRNSQDWTNPGIQPALSDLLTSLQHRLYLLGWHYNPGFHHAPPEPVVCTSRLIGHGLHWRTLNRYSNRSATHKPISGMTGWLLYGCDDPRWDGLLSAARLAGLGRQTIMGLGDLCVQGR